MQGVRVRDNLCGTDLIPALLESAPGRSFFMLGADGPTIHQAARRAESRFPGWTLAGFHHGYLDEPAVNDWAIEQINASRADVLLVGMGNPRQERWLDAHRDRLDVPVAIGVGGLFDFWAETVSRAPCWLRRLGHEWIWRLLQQPRDKAQRYLIGNPVFLARALRERWWGC
jgi:N-acetylglucosaminyldiphosphoundecaprenol N-acetyl-beta-D-mannosaminyltransferase